MATARTTPKNIDEYIAAFSPDMQAILEQVRLTIRKAAPGAQETISYRIPTFTLSGALVYFAALLAAVEAFRVADYERAFHHLERAHIIGQRFTMRHVRVHWLMLKYAVALRNPREVLGQLIRIVAAALFSRIWVPIGNTGRANVSAMRPMPISDDLRYLLEKDGA